MCTNRTLNGNLCIPPCPADKPVRGKDYSCHSCDEEKPFISPAECYKCPNRILGGLNNNYCSLPCGEAIYENKPLMESYGLCHSCDEDNGIRVLGIEETCSAICPNRTAYGAICSKTCPDDKPLPSYSNGCLACDDPTPAHVLASKTACAICPNRVMYGSDYCILPCGEGIYEDKPLTDSTGVCHLCTEEKPIRTGTGSACAQCDNRELLGDMCVLSCPEDKPLVNVTTGECYACDDPTPVYMKLATSACSRCSNRVLQGSGNAYCSLPCDEGIYEDMPLPGRYGDCYACDDPRSIDVYQATDVCQKICSNRHLADDGYHCLLNE